MTKGRYNKKRRSRKPKKVGEAALKLASRDADSEVETTVFRSGNSDAVRLPKSFGLLGKKVKVRRDGSRVIVELAEKRKWPPGFFESFSGVDDDFEVPPRSGPDLEREERLLRMWDEPIDD